MNGTFPYLKLPYLRIIEKVDAMRQLGKRRQNVRVKRNSRPGMTLVEIMAVMIVIAILMSLVLGVAGLVGRKQDKARAVAELAYIKGMIDEYVEEAGQIPTALTFGRFRHVGVG